MNQSNVSYKENEMRIFALFDDVWKGQLSNIDLPLCFQDRERGSIGGGNEADDIITTIGSRDVNMQQYAYYPSKISAESIWGHHKATSNSFKVADKVLMWRAKLSNASGLTPKRAGLFIVVIMGPFQSWLKDGNKRMTMNEIHFSRLKQNIAGNWSILSGRIPSFSKGGTIEHVGP